MKKFFDSLWDSPQKMIGFVVAIMVLLIALLMYAEYSESENCYNRGGKMEETGETITYYTKIGHTLIPNTIKEKVCVIPEEEF